MRRQDDIIRRRASARYLPPDVLIKIVRYTMDASSVFSFLSVLDTPGARGDLESLWQLGLQMNVTALWPVLHIWGKYLDTPSTASHLEAILPHYSHIVVEDVIDLVWLGIHLNPSTTVTWRDIPTSDVEHAMHLSLQLWYSLWSTSFQITHLILSDRNLDFLVPELSSLRHLTHLTLNQSTCSSPASLCAWLPTSAVVELHLIKLRDTTSPVHFTPLMLRHLQQWLHTRPVRHLQLHQCRWEHFGEITAALFCEMFSSPTLLSLELARCPLPYPLHLPDRFPPTLRTLALQNCQCLDSDDVQALPPALMGSNVVRLSLRGFNDADNDAYLDLLFNVLAQLRLSFLDLSDCGIVNSGVNRLVKYLTSNTSVETLVLDDNAFSVDGAVKIAQAMQTHPSLRHLHVVRCEIGHNGVMALLTYLPKSMKALFVGPLTSISPHELNQLKTVAKLANVQLDFAYNQF
ncbi:Aste57867_9165 [Aphanomyces stellatus]|uniref:Aste57867_9165 protein n=1 Tax=Aphanomyces stellatus TaxID=120398 RepID=A0A485KM65_9STRA|nr:hypothetical protein As57867_009129 [Aphanomyces stellatus]VFT86049.1 Aste57867_9165 [Aphanomyces stellatus]